MINIILADDHQVVRKGLKALLSAESEFSIIGEAGDGLETIKLVEQLQPEILVLDLMMAGINGLEVTRQLSKKNPKTGIVILSMHSNEAYVLEALRCGAKAYILKDSPPEELVKAIKEVFSGRRYLSAPLSERAIEAYTQRTEVKPLDPYDQLTTREREILQLTAQGCTNNEIASRLFISARTVETHRTNLMRKLDLHNHIQLIQFAIQHGIIPGKTYPVNCSRQRFKLTLNNPHQLFSFIFRPQSQNTETLAINYGKNTGELRMSTDTLISRMPVT